LETTVERAQRTNGQQVARLEAAEFAPNALGAWTIRKPKEPFTLIVVLIRCRKSLALAGLFRIGDNSPRS